MPALIVPFGVDGLLVRFSEVLNDADNRAALAFKAAVDQQAWPGIVETASSMASVMVRFNPADTTRADVTAAIKALLAGHDDWRAVGLPEGRTLWRVPATFGGDFGPQLAEAAHLAGITQDEAIAQISRTRLRVLAIGFAPGQPYLGMMPEAWNFPRQGSVTPQVPSGALVVAIRQLIIFGVDSPTGWRHIGQSAFRCFRPDSQQPFPLAAGDEVQIVPISAERYRTLAVANEDGNGGAQAEALT